MDTVSARNAGSRGDSIRWVWKDFRSLSGDEVYAVLALRQEVFVLEQRCLYRDIDGRDQESHHLLGYSPDGRLIAYLRLVPPGLRFPDPCIGRVVVRPEVRGTGSGRELMVEGLRRAEERYPGRPVCISAQAYLERFYSSLGFMKEGEEYDEDGIPHIAMIRSARR